jgi:hypothetical protein
MGIHMGIEFSAQYKPLLHRRDQVRPLGLLTPLVGRWQGTGFNQIFRPDSGDCRGDSYLKLNSTRETMEFTPIVGTVPNRRFLADGTNVAALTYLQQVTDANDRDPEGRPAALHIETGIWLNVPRATHLQQPSTVARLANIPHGVALAAQGCAEAVAGPPRIEAVDITPYRYGDPASHRMADPFHHLTQLQDGGGRTADDAGRSQGAPMIGITRATADNPNSVLEAALADGVIRSHIRIEVATPGTTAMPRIGGGVANIEFLDESCDGARNTVPTARVVSVQATFWISPWTDPAGQGLLLQYSQVVVLDFDQAQWPHVSVADLHKVGAEHPVEDLEDLLGSTGQPDTMSRP